METLKISQEPALDGRLWLWKWGDEFQQGVMKQENKSRNLPISNAENLIIGNTYILSGTYLSGKNFYEITQVILSNKKNTFGAWIKTIGILLISLLLTAISYLIFPKFWKE